MADPVRLESLDAALGDRGVADVECLGGQAGGDTHVQVDQAALASRPGGECRDEPRAPGHHLQDDLGQVHPGQHRGHPSAQVDQARRVGDGHEALHVQPAVVIDADRAVVRHAGGEVHVALVQGTGVAVQQLAGVLG